jgi:hydrogenase expression/formation protein HypE
LFCVPKPEAQRLLAALQAHPLGRDAAIIGDVIRKPQGMAIVETAYGSRRVLEMPMDEQLPRIC